MRRVGRSHRSAFDVPDRALRRDRLRVRLCQQDLQAAFDPRLVEPRQTPPRHLGRSAVAEAPRGGELEREPAIGARRVQRRQPQRPRIEEVARAELDLGIDVAPVVRHRGDGRQPRLLERRPRDRRVARRRHGRRVRDDLQATANPLAVDARQQAAQTLETPTLPRDRQLHAIPELPRPERRQQRCDALGTTRVVDDERKPDIRPVGRQLRLELAELVGDTHRPEHRLTAVAKVEKKGVVSPELLREFFREMLLIRRFEEKVEERFRAGELPGFLHVAIGKEAVAVGVCRALEEGDVIASTHRAHGHTLAKGTHPNELMAELYGKLEGCSHGYGGSMHLYDVERGNLGANAVVGGGLPAIVGAALAFKFRDEPRVAVAFFGDGATNIGTVHESLNLAQLWQVPAVFVLENNHWAESTPASQHLPIKDLSQRAVAYGMETMTVDGQDVGAVHETATKAIEHARSGSGPVFLVANTYRLTGHYVGDPQVYRPKDELRKLRDRKSVV